MRTLPLYFCLNRRLRHTIYIANSKQQTAGGPPRFIVLIMLLTVGCLLFSSCESQKEKKLSTTNHASGTFEVKMTSTATDTGATAGIGRFSLDKQFHGDLEGASKGEMLAISTTVSGSAGYVAMEQVTGVLSGRKGTFALQHTGTMNRGAPELSVTVVPDSGTGELVGLSGKLDIKISDGKHFYEFDYVLAAAEPIPTETV